MPCYSVIVALLSMIALMVMLHASCADGKRGCANFGHSCYGGMGKRASELMDNDEIMPITYQDEENPAFVFTGPRSNFKSSSSQKLTKQQYYDAVSRIIRNWIQNYRDAAQETPNEV